MATFEVGQLVRCTKSTGLLQGKVGAVVRLPTAGDPTYCIVLDGVETYVEDFDIEPA